MAQAYNQDALRLIKPYLDQFFAGAGAALPTGAPATVGTLFVKTGDGLYVCTAATASASTWKKVSTAA